MTLKELLKTILWQDIAIALVTAYPNQRKLLEGYQIVFENLNAHWFTDHFTGKDAPSCYDEIDRYTLKSALKEIAHQILYVAKEL